MPKAQPTKHHQLTVRIPHELAERLDAYAAALKRSYRDLAEAAIRDYLGRLKLTPEQQRKVRALLGE